MSPRALAPLLLLVAACTSAATNASGPRLVTTNAPRSQAERCANAYQQALAQPDLEVDKVPTPVAYKPAPIGKAPPGVRLDRNSEIQIRVIVDTMGRADMKTFKVVKSTHPWLAKSVRNAVRQWKFEPAEIGGCKVRRTFKFGASAGR